METGNQQQPIIAYREREVEQLFHWIKDGESASIIGVSNIGKSNLFQYLLDPGTQKHYLAEDAAKYLFIRVNFHNLPDFNSRSVYSLILEQMEMLDQDTGADCLPDDAITTIVKYHEALLDAHQDELKIQRFFKLAVRVLLQDPHQRLVLLMDQFDQLYQKAGGQLFNNLRGLRDTYKYRISYLVFARDSLMDLLLDMNMQRITAEEDGNEEDQNPLLFENGEEQAREEFYELLQPNQLFLKPYQLEDTERLLRSISNRKRLPLNNDWIQPLYLLTGGHAGLLRMCYSFAATTDNIQWEPAIFLANDSVRQECLRIWASLDDDEKTALASSVKNFPAKDINETTWWELKQKGMLTEGEKVFSQLFEQFIQTQKTRLDRPFVLDTRRPFVYYHGQRSKQLSKSEYLIVKKLYERKNSIVSQEELLHACFPKDDYNEKTSPPVITAHIHRIRKKMGITERDKVIEAQTGLGYILNTETEDEKKPR